MRNRSLVATAALTAALAAGAAPGYAGLTADKKITPQGVGKVKLGAAAADLRAAGLIGRLKPGCELEGPNTRFARLKAPLKGTVDLSQNAARKVTGIHIRGGAAARGVGIGDRLADITAAFPARKVIHDAEPVFGITRVKIPKTGGGRMDFVIEVSTGKITSVDIPRLKLCD
jgi:hypothetical protein